jgi:hypothetical protein
MKMTIPRLMIMSLIACAGGVQASTVLGTFDCQKLARTFLASPSKNNMEALKVRDGKSCWQVIGSSNVNLEELLRSVRKGNFWAASYLAANLKSLDGGNLEDSLVALGKFSDADMESFLVLARKGLISTHEFNSALTMLPLSMSDDQIAQLSAMEDRAKRVKKIARKDLSKQKVLALKAINEFISEIKATMSES